jgi:hypothetical protein
MKKAARESEIAELARGLAKPGTKFRSIELQLRVKYPEAVSVLKDPFLRREIELSCQGRSIYDF